jgi:type IV secretion system protein VirD4
VREILAAAEKQDEGFDATRAALRDEHEVRQTVDTLDVLHRSFGDDQK